MGSAFASGRRHPAEPDDSRLLLFPSRKPGTATDSLNRGLFQAQQHIAASEGSAARGFSQGIKRERGDVGGEREREREMC